MRGDGLPLHGKRGGVLQRRADRFRKGRLQGARRPHAGDQAGSYPTPYFPNVLKHYTWFPVHPPTIEKFGGMKERLSKWTQEEFVCNGPFVLEEWTQNKIIRVKKSPTYWDAANVKLNGIHYLPIQEANTEERLFRSGAMHLGYTCPLDKIPYYKERFPELIHMDPMYASYFYRVNTTPPSEDMPPDQRAAREALAKREVRMALALAIDQQQIVEHLLRGGQIPASGITPRDQSYDTPRVISYQPDRARELLAEAGYPKGRGFPAGVDILINTSEAHKAVAEVVQEMWRKELNIEIAVRNEEWKVYLETQRELNFNISRAGWNADYHDPFTFLSMFVKDGGNNNTGWSSEEYEKLLADSTRTADPKERIAILQKAETVLLEDAPILPIYWYTRTYLLHPAVKGWHPKLLDNRPFKTISLDPNWRDSFSGTAPAGIGG
ncbi:MAG: peptide ABC transporter substrate-binding protein [Verrucomicrobiales bacterium]